MVAALVSAAALACTPHPGAGTVAYISAGSLKALDLTTCKTRQLVSRAAAGPVAFSSDGEWIAFGHGSVVSARGGRVLAPIGSVERWAWSPNQDVLAGLTAAQGIVEGGPETKKKTTLAPKGWGANSFAWSQDGRSLAVGRGQFHGQATAKGIQQLVVFDPAGHAKVVYHAKHETVAPPLVAGWISQLVFFQPDPQNSASLAADGLPLLTVDVNDLKTGTVAAATLPLPGFVVACSGQAAVVVGNDRNTQTNKRIIRFDGTRNFPVVSGGGRAWLEPACPRGGDSLAVAAGPDRPAPGRAGPQRSIWLVTFDGRSKRQLTDSPKGWSDESPAWTPDGKAIAFLRERAGSGAGSLYLFRVRAGTLSGPLATGVTAFAISP